jgi:hypothetical protein
VADQRTLRDVAVAALADTVDRSVLAQAEMRAVALAVERLAGLAWPPALARVRADPQPADVPLLSLASSLGLSDVEILAVALTSAVEEDMLVGRAVAFMQTPVGGSRPTLGLLSTAFAQIAPADRRGRRGLEDLWHGNAITSGLLYVLNDGAPLAECAAGVPHYLCLALAGYDAAPVNTEIGVAAAADVPLPESFRIEAARQAAALDPGRTGSAKRALVIRSGSEAEARAVAAAVASSLGKRALFIESEAPPGLAPLLLLRDLLPVYRVELAPGERRRVPAIAGWRGPVLITGGPDGSIESHGGTAVTWVVPVPTRAERQELWSRALQLNNGLSNEMARDHRHGSGRIAQLGRLMRHRLDTENRTNVTRADLAAAAWAGEGSGLDALAEPMPEPVPNDALVMPPALRRDLDLFLQRCRAREGLVTGLGAAALTRYHPGVRALFVGPSGTGKTLAAGWLATRLGMPLYRVDLASVTSKYIGETEKNLAQLLARAEHAEVMLLFDEADSLFGKRTDVKDSNDRFANAQTNYLLQRIETFDSVAVLTSNSRGRFDNAFTRRLDAVIEFPQPGPEERRAIWYAHLGDGHSLTPIDVSRVAARVDLSGGHVRNAVLTAAVLARRDDTPLSWSHVAAGIAAECRKLGRTIPSELGISDDA